MTEAERAEQNRAYEEAAGIVKKEMPLDARADSSPPGWLARRRLSRAISLFERVVQLNPANWTAFWLMGKVHLRLQNLDSALACFERAHEANPAQPDILREASRCAMDLGLHDAALDLAQRAVQMSPNSAVLRANLALACLIAGRLPDAQLAAIQAVMGDPGDETSQQLKAMVEHFSTEGITPPETPVELFEYWQKHGAD